MWLGRAVTAVQPILVRRAQVVFSRPFQGHLELYREMLQLPACQMGQAPPPTHTTVTKINLARASCRSEVP